MHGLARVGLVATACLLSTSAANAQTCLGLPMGRANLSGIISFPEDASSFGARLGLNRSSTFGGASVQYQKVDELDMSATSFGVDIGTSLPVGTNGGSLRLCPVGGAAFTSGPNLEFLTEKVETSAISLSGGLALGGSMELSPGVSVMPNAALRLLHNRYKISMTGALFGEEEETGSETGGILAVGLGIIFNSTFGVQPSVSIPFGFDGLDPVISLSVSIGFNRR